MQLHPHSHRARARVIQPSAMSKLVQPACIAAKLALAAIVAAFSCYMHSLSAQEAFLWQFGYVQHIP